MEIAGNHRNLIECLRDITALYEKEMSCESKRTPDGPMGRSWPMAHVAHRVHGPMGPVGTGGRVDFRNERAGQAGGTGGRQGRVG